MKKYRLIKEYPGSPKIGAEVSVERNEYVHWNLKGFEIDQYKEFWKELVEKDYEILSFQRIDTKGISYLKNDNYYHHESNYGSKWSIEEMLDCKMCMIYSIKRLSDGEIFTIGDNTKYGCIDKFYIKSDYLLATTVLESFGRHLNHLEKIKQPLFTTKDGVDIFEGDKFYFVKIKESKSIDKLWEVSEPKGLMFIHEPKIELYFSSKEKAEEYILMNKPCLSLQEVLNIVTFLDRSEKKLKELVKQKLNKNN